MINNTHSFLPSKKVILQLPDTNSFSYRFQQRSDMQARIYAQMLFRVSQGYKIYFGTLTYNPKHRPYFSIDRIVSTLKYDIKDKIEYSIVDSNLRFSCPCFSRSDIRRFTRGIQMDLLKQYGVTDYDYIVASEYGSNSEFCPHYHFILFVPGKYKLNEETLGNLNAYKVYTLVKKHWSRVVPNQYEKNGAPVRESLGFIFPRTVLGGRDRKGHMHKPFEVNTSNMASLVSTAIYTSKYCCKQIGFWKNPSVVYIYNELKHTGTEKELKEFRKSKPFIKTSLHFGECLNEVVFGNASWSNGLLQASENPLEALYKGFNSPLKEPTKFTSFPAYNKRKLLYEYTLDFIREDETYPDVGAALWLDITRLNDELIPTIKKTYQYGYHLTEFGKAYKQYEFSRSIEDYENKLCDFRITDLESRNFIDFLASCGYDHLFSYLREFLNLGKNLHLLSLYKKVYQNRVNPVYYWWFLDHPEDFEDVTKVEKYKTKYSIIYPGGLVDTFTTKVEYYQKYSAKDSLLSIDFEQYSDFIDKYNFGKDFAYPYFDYNSNSDYMCANAFQFYICDDDLHNSPLNQENCENFPVNLFFNCFPCFANYDLILMLLDAYMHQKAEVKLRSIENKEKIKSNFKNQVYAV